MNDFQRDLVRKYFPKLTPQEQEEVLRAVPPEARLAGLTPQEQEELLQTVPPEKRLEGLPPEERLSGLSEQQIRQYLDQLTSSRKTPSRKPRKKKK